MPRKNKAIFQLRKPKVTHAAKKQSDIPAVQAQGHPCREKVKRYSGSASPRSRMPRKSKAIFLLRKHKVTHAAKKQSDISAPQAQGHPYREDKRLTE